MKLPSNFLPNNLILEKVAFDLFGLELLEPLSSITNWIMAIQCFYFVSKLATSNDYLKYWRWFFLIYGFSFFFGGLSHLLFNYTDMMGKIPGWSCALIGISVAEWAMTFKLKAVRLKSIIRGIIALKLGLIIILLVSDFKFLWVMLHITGLIFFVGIPSGIYWKQGLQEFKYFIYSIGLLLMTAPIKLLKIDIHPAYFNRDDIGHVFMIIAFWVMFKAVRLTGLLETNQTKA